MSTIAKQLIEWGLQVGRWLVERVLRRGAYIIGAYILERAESVFPRRLALARKRLKKATNAVARRRLNRRIRILKGRIERWTKAGQWLMNYSKTIAKCMADEVDVLIREAAKLPETPKCERLVAA